jgi:hypothetical protein
LTAAKEWPDPHFSLEERLSLMPSEIDTFWNHLKRLGRKTAASGTPLTLTQAESVVAQAIHDLGMNPDMPDDARLFFAQQLLEFIQEAR